MIKIVGNRGEGAGLFTNLAIEKLLETQSNFLCLLVDDTSEFSPLVSNLNGITIAVTQYDKDYKEYLLSRLNEGNFFRLQLYISSGYTEYILEEIEELARNIEKKYSRKVFLIYKTVNPW